MSFSLGAVLFEMLAGRKAFEGGLGGSGCASAASLPPEFWRGEFSQILPGAGPVAGAALRIRGAALRKMCGGIWMANPCWRTRRGSGIAA